MQPYRLCHAATSARGPLASLPPYLPFHLVAGAGTLSNQPFELQVENWVAKGNNCDSGVVLRYARDTCVWALART